VDCSGILVAGLTAQTAANGDVLAVQFTPAKMAVHCSFGRVELAVNSIQKTSISTLNTPTRTHAEWTDVTYADGQVGRAFSLNGFSSCAKFSASQSLDVGKGDGLTLSAWIRPTDVSGFHPIMEWNPGGGIIGVQLWIGHTPEDYGLLSAFVDGTDGQPNGLTSATGAVVSGSFQFVAVTYYKASGEGALYLNGTKVAQVKWGWFEPLTKGGMWISYRLTVHSGDWT
jgi:hypothetical protein